MADHEPGVHIREDGKKVFIPLENNPEVFTELVHRLGVSEKLSFHDVYSISDPELLAFVPRPCHALIFISPGDVYYRVHGRDEPQEIKYDGTANEEPVVWFKQTIGNTCGFIALLHGVANGSAREYITRDSMLDNILKEALPLKPDPRAEVLYNSRELERVYMASATQGDSAAPRADEPVGYHFLAFVKGTNGHLFELEGSFNGPVDLGELKDEDDCLSEKALALGVGRYVEKAEGNMEFSIIALCG
jgi:ubiquitin carboxyl-terminal hydrolase L3